MQKNDLNSLIMFPVFIKKQTPVLIPRLKP